MLCAVGDLVEDIVAFLEGPPRRATDATARIIRRRGGSAANVAAFAALDGAPSRFVGRVGDDALGARLVAELAATGADVRVQRAGRTGSIVVLVEPGGERTMLPDRAACTELVDVPPEWIDGTRVLHLPAYSLVVEPLATTALGLATLARASGAAISVDASSVAVVDALGIAAFRALLGRLRPDVLLANADEAAALRLVGDPLDVLAVVKDGADPVRVVDRGGPARPVEVPRLARVVDTTGAGDAFAAGFLPAWAAARPLEEAVAAGNRLAARVLAGLGR